MTNENQKRNRRYFFVFVILGLLICATPVTAEFWSRVDTTLYTYTDGDDVRVNGSLYADGFHGDGGNLTNISGNGNGNPFNQDLNTTDDVLFNNVNVTNELKFGSSMSSTLSEVNNMTTIDIDGLDGFNINISRPIFILNNAGIVTKPYESSCRVRLRYTQAVPSSSWTQLLLVIEDYDQNHDFGINKFVAPVDGVYLVTYSVFITDLANGCYLQSAIYKNGVISGGNELQVASDIHHLSQSGTDCFYLLINDYLELYVYHNHPTANRLFPDYTYSNYMTVCKIA